MMRLASVTHSVGRRCARVRATTCVAALPLLLAVMVLSVASNTQAQESKTVPMSTEKNLLAPPAKIPAAPGSVAAEQTLNPHWRRDACQACHEGTPSKADTRLRDTDIDRLCNTCHAYPSSHSYIHPVGMPLSKEMQGRMPASFRLVMKRSGGNIGCVTCHDLPMQCLPENARKRDLNPLFFRDGPYRQRTDLCYRCHDPRYYQRLNAHDQVAKDGTPREDSCRICHSDAKELKDAHAIEDAGFNDPRDLSSMCTGCHVWIPHPGSFSFRGNGQPNHLVVPSPGIARQMQRVQKKNDVRLPLEPGTGKVFCGTCHNPHAKGVPMDAAASKGADAPKRLRVPEICVVCHDK